MRPTSGHGETRDRETGVDIRTRDSLGTGGNDPNLYQGEMLKLALRAHPKVLPWMILIPRECTKNWTKCKIRRVLSDLDFLL